MCLHLLGARETMAPAAFMELTAYSNSNHIFYRLVHPFKETLLSLYVLGQWITNFSTHQNHMEG